MTALVAGLLCGAAGLLVVPLPRPPRMPAAVRAWRPGALLVTVVVGVLGWVAGGVVAGAGAATGVGVGWRLRARSRRERADEAGRAAAVELVAVLAAELRSGRPPAVALAAAAQVPGCAALARVARAVDLGEDPAAVLPYCVPEGPLRAALGRVALAWRVAERSGVPLGEVLDRVEADLRASLLLRRRLRVELAGTTATGRVLAVLPLLGVALGEAMGGHPVQVLLHTPTGAVCALLGLVLEAIGMVWTARLGQAALRRAG